MTPLTWYFSSLTWYFSFFVTQDVCPSLSYFFSSLSGRVVASQKKVIFSRISWKRKRGKKKERVVLSNFWETQKMFHEWEKLVKRKRGRKRERERDGIGVDFSFYYLVHSLRRENFFVSLSVVTWNPHKHTTLLLWYFHVNDWNREREKGVRREWWKLKLSLLLLTQSLSLSLSLVSLGNEKSHNTRNETGFHWLLFPSGTTFQSLFSLSFKKEREEKKKQQTSWRRENSHFVKTKINSIELKIGGQNFRRI